MNVTEFVQRVCGYINLNGDEFDIDRANIVDEGGVASIKGWTYSFPSPSEADLQSINLAQTRKRLNNRGKIKTLPNTPNFTTIEIEELQQLNVKEGQLVYNSDTKKIMFYNGSIFNNIQ